jgi:hypothetical protein
VGPAVRDTVPVDAVNVGTPVFGAELLFPPLPPVLGGLLVSPVPAESLLAPPPPPQEATHTATSRRIAMRVVATGKHTQLAPTACRDFKRYPPQ